MSLLDCRSFEFNPLIGDNHHISMLSAEDMKKVHEADNRHQLAVGVQYRPWNSDIAFLLGSGRTLVISCMDFPEYDERGVRPVFSMPVVADMGLTVTFGGYVVSFPDVVGEEDIYLVPD